MSFASALNSGLNLGTAIGAPFATWQQRQRESQLFPLQVQSLKASIAGEEARSGLLKQQTADLTQIHDLLAKWLGGGDADPSLETAFAATQEALRTIGSGRSVLSGLQQDVAMQYGARSPQPVAPAPAQRPTAFSPLLEQIKAQQVNATAGLPPLSPQATLGDMTARAKANTTATIDALLANGPLSADQMAAMDDATLSRLEAFAGMSRPTFWDEPFSRMAGGALAAPFQAAEWALGPLANLLNPGREQSIQRSGMQARVARIREVLRAAEEKRRAQLGQRVPGPSMSAAPRP